MHRTRIKICGLTRAGDAAAAVAAGADALGVVLAPSKRQVTIERAAAALADVPPFVTRVGVFVDADPEFVAEAVARLGLTVVQYHGDESPDACACAPAPAVKSFRVGPDFDAAAVERYRGSVTAVLFDACVAGQQGGTGVTFDWYDLADLLPRWAPVVLAGGLGPHNVGEALHVLRPFAVDVSSGVEHAPGVKDSDLIEAFAAAVRAADLEVSDV